jgi:tetratricopeptide (TPR) repeat protein
MQVFVGALLLSVLGAPGLAGGAGDALGEPRHLDGAGDRILLPVPVPDISGTETVVQEKLNSARASLAALLQTPGVDDAALANAYGEMGALYQAHHVYIPAESCYINAETLAPGVFRWPYLLGYLSVEASNLEQARAAFERAVKIRPDYGPGQLRLAQVYLDLNQPDLAEALYRTTMDNEQLRGASLFGLGRIAIMRRQYEEASRILEAALAVRPQASKIHYSLAMAYRGLGDVEQARRQLALYGDGEPEVPDPVVDELDGLLTGGRTHLTRAMDAVETRQYDVAVEAFRKALEPDPGNANLRVSLARTLYLTGDRKAAEAELREALRREPTNDLANFLTGVLRETDGDDAAAETYYLKVLSVNPDHAGAHHFIANIYMRRGQYARAAEHYHRAVVQVPRNTTAGIMELVALLGAGAPQGDIRARLEDLVPEYAEQPMYPYLLARLLAASPEDHVRDGARALTISESLLQQYPAVENVETLAMAYAETGRYDKAIESQDAAIGMAFSTGRVDSLPRLERNLARYRDGKPCREPLAADDPMLRPPPLNPDAPFRDYPAGSPY